VRSLPVVIPVVVLGAVGIVAAVTSLIVNPPGGDAFLGVAGLLAAAIAAEAFPLPIEGVNVGTGTTSLAIVAIVSTGVIYGWREAAVVGFLTMAVVESGRGRRASRIVFNTGMYVCAGILSVSRRRFRAATGSARSSSRRASARSRSTSSTCSSCRP